MSVLALLSGGVDSVTMLTWLLDADCEVEAISFDYNQRHSRELDAARYWTQKLNVRHHFVDACVFSGSALTGDKPVPHGHYADASMRSTVVPNRNMVFLAIAASKALQFGLDAVAYAAHAGDASVYPDCRPGFARAMSGALGCCDYKPVELMVPFLRMSKGEIVALGLRLGVDYSRTWSCYEGGETPCGKCGPCTARVELGI